MKTHFILFILSLFVVNSLWGEAIKFEYDASGNRIKRQLITLRSATAEETPDDEEIEDEAPQVFTDILSQSTIQIYPNPTKGLLKVEITGDRENNPVSLQVYDMNGRVLVQESNVVSSTVIDLSNHFAGIYILKLTAGKESNEWKIIKE
jgi:hypothetical protein